MKKRKALASIASIIGFIPLIASCSSISTRTYELSTPIINEGSVTRIVLISDLHSEIYGKDQSLLINLITGLNPDLIIICGDLFDSGPMTGVQLLLSGISGVAPVYFVTGNHEYTDQDINEIRDELRSFGVITLSDEYRIIEINSNKIILAGIEDPERVNFELPDYNQYEIMEKVFRELDRLPYYKILVAHRPERIEYYKKFAFDLIVSGHTHGGQIRIPPFKRGLYAPDQGLFPKYSGGMYSHENLTHIISRGLARRHPGVPRIFNPPEIVLIIIDKEG